MKIYKIEKIITTLIIATLLTGCTQHMNAPDGSSAAPGPTNSEQITLQENKSDATIAKADFMDIRWTRSADGDTENIFFSSDGSFSYSCACGNPVNDSDLCEGYAYDEEKKEITLRCFEKTEDMVTTIIVKKCDKDSIELDFDGEIRKFTKSQEE